MSKYIILLELYTRNKIVSLTSVTRTAHTWSIKSLLSGSKLDGLMQRLPNSDADGRL